MAVRGSLDQAAFEPRRVDQGAVLAGRRRDHLPAAPVGEAFPEDGVLGFEGLLGAFYGAVGIACDRREVVGGGGREPRDRDVRGDHVGEVAFGPFGQLGGRSRDFDARARAGLRCRRHFPGRVAERVFAGRSAGSDRRSELGAGRRCLRHTGFFDLRRAFRFDREDRRPGRGRRRSQAPHASDRRRRPVSPAAGRRLRCRPRASARVRRGRRRSRRCRPCSRRRRLWPARPRPPSRLRSPSLR